MDLSWLTHNYLTRGFWGDEAWTAGISRLGLKEIITVTSQDFHPPLYYFFVHYIGGLFNYAEVPVRLISTFFFLLIPVVTYYLTRMLWQKEKSNSNLTSLLGSLLVLLSPILFTYAFEARSYGLLALESVTSAYVFWRAKDEAKGQYRWRLAYFLLGGAMVYTHYYSWFVLASHAFYLLLFERKRILPMLTSAIGILLVQLPWLPTLLSQTSSVKDSYWIGAINSRTHFEFFLRVTGGDVTTAWQKPLAYLIGGIILMHFLYQLVKKKLSPSHKFLLTWLIIPTLLPTLVSIFLMPVFFYRYLIFSAIPLLILTVYALKSLPKPIFLLITLLVAIMEFQVSSFIFRQYPRSMRDAVSEMYQKKTDKSPVYTVLPAFAEAFYYVKNDPIIVEPLGLVQFSGKSLLDEYVRLGKVKIEEPPKSSPYWFLAPEEQAQYVKPNK